MQYALWDKKEIKIQFAESQHSRWVFFQHKMSFSIYFQCKTTDIDIANSMFTFNPTYSNDECCYSKTNISFLLNSQQVGWAGQCLLWGWRFDIARFIMWGRWLNMCLTTFTRWKLICFRTDCLGMPPPGRSRPRSQKKNKGRRQDGARYNWQQVRDEDSDARNQWQIINDKA